MNRILKNTLIIVALSLFVIACEPADDPEPTGDPRDAIEDTWECNEVSPSYGETTYSVDIAIDPNNSNGVVMDNFYNLGFGKDVTATLSGDNLTISSQLVDGTTISGSGLISGNKKLIDWSYSVDEGDGAETVTASFTRD